jgi:uncharacterized protein (TIGR04222 family)
MINATLWSQILAFDFDQPLSEYGFSVRLAKENFWTQAFTQKAILEYKKFMYLAATQDAIVSPSEIVDIVWHQHLVFTQSYTDFCHVLGKVVQHVPSTHNRQDASRFKQAKERTHQLYQTVFGEPPADVWQYATMPGVLQLSKARYKLRSGLLVGLLLLLVGLIPMYFLLSPLYLTISSGIFLPAYIGMWVIVLVVMAFYSRSLLEKLVNGFNKSFIHDLRPAELIYLKSQQIPEVIHAALDSLIKENKIQIQGNTFAAAEGAQPTTAEEFTILDALRAKGPVPYETLLRTLASKPVFTNVSSAMSALQKYLNKSEVFTKLFYLNFGVFAFVLSLGLVRLAMGLLREKPVTLLVIVLVISGVVMMLALWNLTTVMTQKIIPAFYRTQMLPAQPSTADPNWQYFLLGTAAVSPLFLPMIQRHTNGGDSSSSDAGSSDSGGGSSCSSCGGCGGD